MKAKKPKSNINRHYFLNHPLDGVILVLIVTLALLSLPALFPWDIFPKIKNLSPKILASQTYRYQHPPIPVIKPGPIPYLLSPNFIVVDNATNTILLAKNPNQRIYPASVTKLATSLTALNIYPLDEVVTIGEKYSDGKVMNLQVGEKITVRNLVSGLLIYSANDAAFNLAVHHSAGIAGFVSEMNQLIGRYGLKNTNFVNFDGIHNSEHYSTVYDLSQLGRLSIKNQILVDVVKTRDLTVTDIDNQILHPLTTTNELLGVLPEIEGLKTGWTPEASGSFVGLVNLNGRYLLTVVAQSTDRFVDTKTLVNWAKSNLTWSTYQ